MDTATVITELREQMRMFVQKQSEMLATFLKAMEDIRREHEEIVPRVDKASGLRKREEVAQWLRTIPNHAPCFPTRRQIIEKFGWEKLFGLNSESGRRLEGVYQEEMERYVTANAKTPQYEEDEMPEPRFAEEAEVTHA